MNRLIYKVPLFANIAKRIINIILSHNFKGSNKYWDTRYARGGNSGPGSYGRLSIFKAEIINNFVRERAVQNVIEWGCGDGNQLALANYPHYIGVDVSPHALSLCKKRFMGDDKKHFITAEEWKGEKADLSLSLDVIYHLVEDETYYQYMERLFGSSDKYVMIYSLNTNQSIGAQAPHVKPRQFSQWIEEHAPQWKLIKHIPNKYPYNGNIDESSFSDFFIYEKMVSL